MRILHDVLPVCDIPVDEVGLESGVGGVEIPVLVDRRGGHAGNCVGDIVVGAGRVIDTVATAASGTPFESTQLVYQLRVVQQIDAHRINQRHQINIQVTVRLGRSLVPDAEFCKLLNRPLSCVVVTHDLRYVIAPQQLRKFANDGLGREWRSNRCQKLNAAVHSLCPLGVNSGRDGSSL